MRGLNEPRQTRVHRPNPLRVNGRSKRTSSRRYGFYRCQSTNGVRIPIEIVGLPLFLSSNFPTFRQSVRVFSPQRRRYFQRFRKRIRKLAYVWHVSRKCLHLVVDRVRRLSHLSSLKVLSLTRNVFIVRRVHIVAKVGETFKRFASNRFELFRKRGKSYEKTWYAFLLRLVSLPPPAIVVRTYVTARRIAIVAQQNVL